MGTDDQGNKRLAPLGVRIPPDLKRKIKIAAAQEDRTMNAQIVRHLREIYQPEENVSA
jgi:predicted HicB family RNase H-like nuclease